jgi:release factor glutamine methyltransferase
MERHDSDGDGSDSRETLAERREMPSVYQPAEDSALLAATVVERIEGGERLLDVGTGSGYVAARAREAGAAAIGTDRAASAVRSAREAGIPVVRTDLMAGVCARFDLVAFNPPYLPTPPEAEWKDPLEAALSGGPDGRRVIRPFLAGLPRVLADEGRGYMLASSLTGLDAVRERAREAGLAAEEVAAESYPYERLVVLALRHADVPGAE